MLPGRAPGQTFGSIDERIRSIIFDALGVSQGGEMTQQHALHLFAVMNPDVSSAIRRRLQKPNQFDLYETVAKRIGGFAASDLHGLTSDSPSDRRVARESMGWLREAVAVGPVSPEAVHIRALHLGNMIFGRDLRSANRGSRGKSTEPATYGLYTANYNSHLLHYAYVADPLGLPPESVQSTASYAARSFTDAIAASDAEQLAGVGISQETVLHLRKVTSWHLDHYPSHRQLVDDAFMGNLLGDRLIGQLPEKGPTEYVDPFSLPR